MKITFNSSYKMPAVFNDFNKSVKNIKETKTDTFESKTSKKDILKNKKVLIGLSLGASILALGAFIISKKAPVKAVKTPKIVKPVKIAKSVNQTTPIITQTANGIQDIAENNLPEYLRNQNNPQLLKKVAAARENLITHTEKYNTTYFNGLTFFGPDSLNKQAVKEGFIKELADAGYEIDRIPTLKEASRSEIGEKIETAVLTAKERFQNYGKRTAIVISELDKLAPDRESTGIVDVARPLISHIQHCGEKGFTVIGDAYNIHKIDKAVARAGRFSMHIYTKPLESEPVSTWKKYIEFIKDYAPKNRQENLIIEALDVISRK